MEDGAWLTASMTKYRVSQKEVAALLKIDPSGVSRIVAGRRKLNDYEVDRLRSFFMHCQRWYGGGGAREGVPEDMGTMPLETALWKARVSATELNKLAGLPEGRIEAALAGNAPLAPQESATVAAALDVPPEWLDGKPSAADAGDVDRRLAAIRGKRAARFTVRLSGMPIYAAPVPGPAGLAFYYEVAERRAAPPPLDTVEGAFGIFVGNGDYGPRFRPGDVIFVHPSKPVTHGKEVLSILPKSSLIVFGVAIFDTAGAVSIQRGNDVVRLSDHGARAQRIVGAWWE